MVVIIIDIIIILIIIVVVSCMLGRRAHAKELSSGRLRMSIPDGMLIPDGFMYFEMDTDNILLYTGESVCVIQINRDPYQSNKYWFFNNILYVGLSHYEVEIFEFAPEIVTPPQKDYDKFVSEAIKKGTAKRICVPKINPKTIYIFDSWKCDTGEQFRINRRWFHCCIVDEDENIMVEEKLYLLKPLKLLRGITVGGTIYASDSTLFPKLLGMLIFPTCMSADCVPSSP